MKRKMGEGGKGGAGWRYGGLAARAEGLHLTKVIGSHGLFRRDRCHFGWMPVRGCQFCEGATERGRAWATAAEDRGRQDRRAPLDALWPQWCRAGWLKGPTTSP